MAGKGSDNMKGSAAISIGGRGPAQKAQNLAYELERRGVNVDPGSGGTMIQVTSHDGQREADVMVLRGGAGVAMSTYSVKTDSYRERTFDTVDDAARFLLRNYGPKRKR